MRKSILDVQLACAGCWTALVVTGVLTPAAGIYVSPSYGWRGFTFTFGHAWMWVHTTPDGFNIGDAATKKEGTSAGDLVYGRVGAWMVGGTYQFGGGN